MAVPNGASCYICLDEGPDEGGKSLMGFAHLSCIVKYAEQKSEQAADRSPAALGLCRAVEDVPQLQTTLHK